MSTDLVTQKNAELVRQRIGFVQLSTDLFTAEQSGFFGKLLSIVDRSPVVEWRRGDHRHNLDFCLIEGKLEPVKSFHLKAAFLAGVSIKADSSPTVLAAEGDVVVSVPVTVALGNRSITMLGGSSKSEVDKHKNNARWMHDAIARAQTRAMKIALENLLGFAFVNLVIESVFGGYEIQRERDVSSERTEQSHKPDKDAMSPEARKIGGRIWRRLVEAQEAGRVSEEQKAQIWRRVQMNIDRVDVLARIDDETKDLINSHGAQYD